MVGTGAWRQEHRQGPTESRGQMWHTSRHPLLTVVSELAGSWHGRRRHVLSVCSGEVSLWISMVVAGGGSPCSSPQQAPCPCRGLGTACLALTQGSLVPRGSCRASLAHPAQPEALGPRPALQQPWWSPTACWVTLTAVMKGPRVRGCVLQAGKAAGAPLSPLVRRARLRASPQVSRSPGTMVTQVRICPPRCSALVRHSQPPPEPHRLGHPLASTPGQGCCRVPWPPSFIPQANCRQRARGRLALRPCPPARPPLEPLLPGPVPLSASSTPGVAWRDRVPSHGAGRSCLPRGCRCETADPAPRGGIPGAQPHPRVGTGTHCAL